jgi:hypothetical protein
MCLVTRGWGELAVSCPFFSKNEYSDPDESKYDRELRVQRRLTAIEQELDAFTQLDSEEQVKKYVAELQSEMAELINANPQNPEERHQVFLLKKRIVDRVLAEARIDENRQIHIRFHTDFLNHAGSMQELDDPIRVSQF